MALPASFSTKPTSQQTLYLLKILPEFNSGTFYAIQDNLSCGEMSTAFHTTLLQTQIRNSAHNSNTEQKPDPKLKQAEYLSNTYQKQSQPCNL